MGGAPKPVKAGPCKPGARNAIIAAGMRSKFALLAVLFAILLAIPLSIASPAAAHPKDELVIGMIQFPPTFQPNIDATLAKSYVLAMALRPFTTYDSNWQLVCMLCTELPTIENGGAKIEDLPPGNPRLPAKGIAVTFTIRPDAKWGDGTPITTDDVLFTWEVGKHPLSGVSSQELYRRILSIDVKDQRSFTLHMDRVEFDYNAINDFQIIPAHLERDAFHDPATYREHTVYDTDTTNPGLYNGPYKITEVVPGSHIVLERNPAWWGKPGYFRRITVQVVENTAALEANLLSGAIDYIAGELGLSLDQALNFERRHPREYHVIYKPSLVFEHIEPDLDNPVFADVRVRQALLLAVDRKGMASQLFADRQPVADTLVNPLDWVHTDDVRHYDFNPDAAKKLLDEAGWREGPGGIRVNDAGKMLSFDLMTTAGNRSREMVEQVLQSQWRKIGADVRIRNQPARLFFGQSVMKRNFDGLAMFAQTSAPESVPRSVLYSEEIPSPSNGFAGQNYAGYRNAKMDKLIDAIEVELDRSKREALWHKLQQLYADELPALPLFFRADAFILPSWLQGLTPTGHQSPSTLWVENWRVEDGRVEDKWAEPSPDRSP
jgi:peptide/nickel transport system substrate-binding protein